MYTRGFFTRTIQLVIEISFSFLSSISVVEVDYSRENDLGWKLASVNKQMLIKSIDLSRPLRYHVVSLDNFFLFLVLLGLRDLSCKFYDPLRSATLKSPQVCQYEIESTNAKRKILKRIDRRKF